MRKELGSTAPKPLHNFFFYQISSLAAASTIPVTNAVVQANIRRSSKTFVMVRSPQGASSRPHCVNALLYLGKIVTAGSMIRLGGDDGRASAPTFKAHAKNPNRLGA